MSQLPLSYLGTIELLTPALQAWWNAKHPGGPTACQRLAWPTILAGKHTLLAAPTGMGKTQAALVPIYQQLVEQPSHGLCILYITPLKALCNDIHARIQNDLLQLNEHTGTRLRVGLRTGDVAPHHRKQFLDEPPDILVITPESLALLLAHPETAYLANVKYVIVDEVHALACNKRGVELAVTLERLDERCITPPQRIGLSATCHPLEVVAKYLGGSHASISTLQVPDRTHWRLDIVDLSEACQRAEFLPTLMNRLQNLIETHRTLLIFTNVRSLAERISWALRRRLPHLADQIAVHHGSIARENRHAVEGQLQRGELRVVLSSTSLELGIDIGSIDHVAFIHAPGGATRMLQRLGRGGHRPGAFRTGTLFVGSQIELLEAVTTKGAAEDGFLEPLSFPDAPLDVLCQLLIGMGVAEQCSVRHAWDLLKRSFPYQQLSLEDFIRCLEYVTGGNSQLDVPPRVKIVDHRLCCTSNLTARLYRTNAGTIQDEPHRSVHLEEPAQAGTPTILGSVPHQFADRLLVGDRFLLTGRVYELKRHERSAIVVQESGGLPAFTRWQGGMWNMPPILAERLWCLRARLAEALLESNEQAVKLLQQEYRLDEAPATSLIHWLERQMSVSEIPDQGLLIEATASPDGEHVFYALHLPLPAAAAEGLARVLCWRLRPGGAQFPIEPGPLGFLITLPADRDIDPERWRVLLSPDDFGIDLLRVISTGPVLGRKFMEAAHTGLMLLRTPLRGKVRKVGGSQWAGDKLLNWLRFAARDFPLLQQAQREAADDYYQAGATEAYLTRLQASEIRLRWIAEPSPLAAEWLPASSTAPETTLNSLDELLLSLGTPQQEAEHVAPARMATDR